MRTGLLVALLASPAAGQLRIATYNTAGSVSDELLTVLVAIAEESVNGISRPVDVLALQEQTTQRDSVERIVERMNQVFGPGVYRRGDLNSLGVPTQGVIYNSQTVQLLEERRVERLPLDVEVRSTLRYHFRAAGYDQGADFWIYNSHFKANDTETDIQLRQAEAAAVRADADQLGPRAHIIYLGDLNLYTSSEPAFQVLTGSGPAQAYDPVSRVGSWHDNDLFRRWHTQSTTIRGTDMRAGGGVDDRFDFQLVTNDLLDGEGFSYIGPNMPQLHTPVAQHSYRSFGNNGTHLLSRAISTGSGAAPLVLAALESASDHLPVVADYQLPARMAVQLSDVPTRVIEGANVEITYTIQNDAPVDSVLGADELDYAAIGLGSLSAAATGTALAGQPGRTHALRLITSNHGPQRGSLLVETNSPQAANPRSFHPVQYTVLAHANGSLAPDRDQEAMVVDFGTVAVAQNEVVQLPIDVYNLDHPSGWTAELMLTGATGRGDTERLALDFTPARLAASQDPLTFVARFDLSQPGSFSAEWQIGLADEPIRGAAVLRPLTLLLRGNVVSPLAGDFDGDAQLTAADIDLLTHQILFGGGSSLFDLSGNGVVDIADHQFWIRQLRRTDYGDANLDGWFDSSDLVHVFRAGEYEDDLVANSGWDEGDWNADLEFDSSDLLLAFQHGGYQRASGAVTRAVPEGLSILCLLGASLYAARATRRHCARPCRLAGLARAASLGSPVPPRWARPCQLAGRAKSLPS